MYANGSRFAIKYQGFYRQRKLTDRALKAIGRVASHCKNLDAPMGRRLQWDVVVYLGQKRYLLIMGHRSKGYVLLSRALETWGWIARLVHEAGVIIVAVRDVSGAVQNPKGMSTTRRLDA